jgi:hypothetical protein
MSDDLIYLNGINGVTGQYLVRPLTMAEAVEAARGRPPDQGLGGWLRRIRDVLLRPYLALPLGVEPTDLARAGWGVVFAKGMSEEVRRALDPLIAHRRRGVAPDRC